MERADVIILGGGLVGLTLAIALDRHGLSTIVVDPADPATQIAPGFDGRATAISSSSWRMLEAIGVARAAGGRTAARSARSGSATGLKPGGIVFDARARTTIRSASWSRTGCSARRCATAALAAATARRC